MQWFFSCRDAIISFWWRDAVFFLVTICNIFFWWRDAIIFLRDEQYYKNASKNPHQICHFSNYCCITRHEKEIIASRHQKKLLYLVTKKIIASRHEKEIIASRHKTKLLHLVMKKKWLHRVMKKYIASRHEKKYCIVTKNIIALFHNMSPEASVSVICIVSFPTLLIHPRLSIRKYTWSPTA